jgi:hypothetical protein
MSFPSDDVMSADLLRAMAAVEHALASAGVDEAIANPQAVAMALFLFAADRMTQDVALERQRPLVVSTAAQAFDTLARARLARALKAGPAT